MTPLTLLYLGVGLVVARIMLDGININGFRLLQWLQLLVNVARITLFWPLVLFIEKLDEWLRSSKDDGSL